MERRSDGRFRVRISRMAARAADRFSRPESQSVLFRKNNDSALSLFVRFSFASRSLLVRATNERRCIGFASYGVRVWLIRGKKNISRRVTRSTCLASAMLAKTRKSLDARAPPLLPPVVSFRFFFFFFFYFNITVSAFLSD